MHKSHEENLGRIKNKLLITEETLKREKREFEFYSNIEKEKNKKIQMKLSQELKDIKDTQKKEKEEEIKREEEAFKEFKIQIEQIKSQFYQDFEKKLIQEIKKLCLLKSKKDLNVDLFSNRLVKQLHQNYDALSKSIFKKAKQNLSSKTEEIYKSKIMLFIEDQFKGYNHINAIAIGGAGVGKSTLINNILKIKGTKMEAKAGKGKSVTKECKIYTSEKVPFLRVYDTPGLDFVLDMETLFKDIKTIVENNLNSNDPDKFINCIWYCQYSVRFQEQEREFIKKLMKLYSSSYLPLIIVLLRYGEGEAEEMKKEIIDIFKETKDEKLLTKTKFCRIVSEDIKDGKKDRIKEKATGFKELLDLTKEEMKNSVESALSKKE